MFHCTKVIMKCPRYEATRADKMEKSSAAESRVLHLKASPRKGPTPLKPQCPPAGGTTVLLSLNNSTKAVNNKEHSKEPDRTLDVLEDSGYLSLQNSQIDDHHGDEENDQIQGKPTAPLLPSAAPHQEKTVSPKNSPSKCQGTPNSSHQVSPVAAFTPVGRPRRRTATYSLSSTPFMHHKYPNLPILNFQQAVCKELEKDYQKNKRYDLNIVTKIAEDHLLDRVIGGKMGIEYIDMFSSLHCRNMKIILTNILALLGDMDLISCKKVSKTWRRIICEDTASLSRCERAEQSLWESSSLRQSSCGLTRDVGVSRVVLSSMQTLASSCTPSSSTPTCRVHRRTASSQKAPPHTRFNEYVQAASTLKQHQSLRQCKLCGSPATHLPEVQRATCTRLSCLFDFCTHCQEAFHGSTPCRVVQPQLSSKTPLIIPGSARSKRNIRRL